MSSYGIEVIDMDKNRTFSILLHTRYIIEPQFPSIIP